jgi:glycosyltransferase involved in cell wall biosynthesis
VSGRVLHLVVPGPIDQRTGGYQYDAQMVTGLPAFGWTAIVHSLLGRFPEADEEARDCLRVAMERIPQGGRVVLDGLASAALTDGLHDLAAQLRLIALIHHPISEETGLPDALREELALAERRTLAMCRGVIVTSEFTADRLERFGVSRARVRVVRPGVDPAPRATGPGEGEPPRLLCVGSVVPRKGQDVLVRALASIQELPWSCVCVGNLERDPGFAGSVVRQVGEAGLSDRIHFVGESIEAELDRQYAGSSIFVLASHYEGYGMALAEALVRGLPVVSTTGGAIPDLVPSSAGILVEPGDDRALAQALRALLDGRPAKKQRAEFAEAARGYGLTLPGWPEAVHSFSDAVLQLTPDA